MTPDDAPAPTRRRARAVTRRSDDAGEAPGTALTTTTVSPDDDLVSSEESAAAETATGEVGTASEASSPSAAHLAPEPPATRTLQWASGRTAFAWVDEDVVAGAPAAVGGLEVAASPYLPVGVDLLARPPRRSPLRPSVLVPTMIIAVLVGAYAATTLLWPLNAVAPEVTAVEVPSIAAPPATITWPAAGSASVTVEGIGTTLASSTDAVQMASITKVVTALVVLEEMPLAVGESGPEFRFTGSDNVEYWQYRNRGESALDVPVGGSLSQYQLLQGMLIGSANNYADRLAGNLWPSDAVFANAARSWLAAHGVTGVTVVEPTGMDEENTASPESLIPLARLALANPVIAEIVATTSVELPGAGLVTNTNGLLADPGVIGIKTGTLDSWNLLSAKNITVGATTVRVYAAVLGQPDNDTRLGASRTLYSDVELGLQPVPSVPAGTVTGEVTTVWGERVDVVTADDAAVILFDGAAGTVTTSFSLDDAVDKGADVGTLSVQGPLDASTTTTRLAGDIEPPTAWWRLTHPLELFGIE